MACGFAGPVSESADSGTYRFGEEFFELCLCRRSRRPHGTDNCLDAGGTKLPGESGRGETGEVAHRGNPLAAGIWLPATVARIHGASLQGGTRPKPVPKDLHRAWRNQANPGDCRNAKIMLGDWGVNPVLNLGATIGLGSGVPHRRPALGVDQRGSGYPCRLGGRGACLASIDHDVRLRSTKGRADWEGARSRLGC